jgi:hypothetical protein
MNKFFYYLSKTDPRLIKGCSAKAKNTQAAFGIFVFFTGIMAFASGAYALKMAWGTNDVRFALGGLLYGLIIMAFDREIVAAKDKKAILVRIPLAIIIGIVLSVPLELKVLEGRINEQLADELGKKNAPNVEKREKETQRLNDTEKELKNSFNHHEQQVQYWAEIMDQELAGRAIEGRTQQAGPGPVYENAKQHWEEEKIARDKARSDLDQFMNNKPKLLQDATALYKQDIPMKSKDLLSRYIALQRLKKNDTPGDVHKAEEAKATKYMSLGLAILIIFIELFPALMKLFKENTDYDDLVAAQTELNKGIITIKTNQRLDYIVNNPGAFIKPDAIDSIQAQMEV